MQKGKIGVTTENIFPIIKQFLYSDHEIFLREVISNAVDATLKLKTLASTGDFKGEMGDLTIHVSLDTKAGSLTISDRGIGMTADEIDQYINQIAFSGAEEFLQKYKNEANGIIGHFGLGFYSVFMVSERVEIYTKSYKEDSAAVKWTCDGSPDYSIEDCEKAGRGSDIVLYFDKDSKEFCDENRIYELLRKYCKFLPVEIAFGKEKEWKDDKEVETGKDRIINNTKPAWTQKPSELTDEDYKKFYGELYPVHDEPLFYIHLNVDYPFNLTGILYFPKIKNNVEIQKNRIQLYCNQVYVTDSVEGIVPDFLMLLHGVLDSPDIPLNVSRSYLQSDSNVKKISAHITKKVADRLSEIFKSQRPEFEKKWDDLKLFIEYGMVSDEKFYERAEKFALLKNTDGKYFTFEEYKELIKDNQTDKNKNLVYLYATNKEEQFSFVETAKNKGYDVLLMDGQLDVHYLNLLEQKMKDTRFIRVDSDVIDHLIQKEESHQTELSGEQQGRLRSVFQSQLPNKEHFFVSFEDLDEKDAPMVITQSEFMRRMKDMASISGGMNFYGEMPDSYNLVVNAKHPLVKRVMDDAETAVGTEVSKINEKMKPIQSNKADIEKTFKDKKPEEIPQDDKDRVADLDKKIKELTDKKESVLNNYAKENKLVRQLIDLALLSNNMLKGEDLTKFVKRSIELI
ncbi:MAG: molecular chaperone HtpG [Bacteroidota bacterium]|nr:molecular chaperone HtpG [Bacteroidota bacterium]